MAETAKGNQATVDWMAAAVAAAARQPSGPAYPVRAEDVEAFQRDGVVLVRGAFADWVERLRAGLQRNLANPDSYAFPCESTVAGEPGRFFDSYCNWALIPEYADFVFDSAAASMAARFMRSRTAQFFHEHTFCKEPGTQKATPWHQDLPYYNVDGHQSVSIYVSLDAAPAEVAVRFVAGSHRWPKLCQPRHFIDGAAYADTDREFDPVPDIEAEPGRFDVRAFDLEPGDTLLFSFRTLHGSGAGRVGARRRAFSTRWLGDDVRYCERPVQTSPPYPGIDLRPGQRMREDWFPVLWREPSAA
jgi:ectoine hydroxylase-related dioxygenase (phytanoyl-CoA dioxygenase family)